MVNWRWRAGIGPDLSRRRGGGLSEELEMACGDRVRLELATRWWAKWSTGDGVRG